MPLGNRLSIHWSNDLPTTSRRYELGIPRWRMLKA